MRMVRTIVMKEPRIALLTPANKAFDDCEWERNEELIHQRNTRDPSGTVSAAHWKIDSRLSMDSAVREKILEASRGRRLLMSHYSRKQFDGMETGSVTELLADDNFLSKAQPGDACFLEG